MENSKEQKKKTGRPIKSIKKEIRAGVRLTQYEYFIIKEKAKQAGMNLSGYIRQTAIHAKLLSRLTDEEVQIVRQLIGMSTNINQVAKVCHREGMFEAMQYFESYRNMIDQLLQKLRP
ncbi:MAG TPA: plasmid mobilization relaxosome protein MobC [Chitinophagaceae bacterium]|nr:plasmid mobilization relaxosome protein MobC [Chitinophagaceae bacterium]